MTLENRVEALERVTPVPSQETIIIFVNDKEIEIHSNEGTTIFPREEMTNTDISEEIKHRFPDELYNVVTFFSPDGIN